MESTNIDSLSEVQGKLADSRFSFRQVLIVFICILVNMVDGFDVVAISVAAPSIAQEWNIAPEILGYVLSAELVGMSLGALILAAFSDKYGRRRILLPSIMLVTLATFLTAYSSTPMELIAARLATGLGIGGVLTSIATLASEFSPAKYRAAVATLVTAGGAVGSLSAAVIADYSLTNFDWQMIFIIGASLGAITLILFALFVPESVEFLAGRRGVCEKRLGRINRSLNSIGIEPLSVLQPPQVSKEKSSGGGQIISPDFLKLTLLLWLVFFAVQWPVAFFTKWFPKLLIDDGFEMTAAVYAVTVWLLGSLLGSLSVSYLSTRFKIVHVIGAMLLLGSVTLLFFIGIKPATVSVLYLFVFVLGAFVGASPIAMYSLPVVSYPTNLRALGLGLCIGVGRIGAILSPIITGYLVDAGWGTYSLFLIMMLPAVLFAMVLLRQIKVPA